VHVVTLTYVGIGEIIIVSAIIIVVAQLLEELVHVNILPKSQTVVVGRLITATMFLDVSIVVVWLLMLYGGLNSPSVEQIIISALLRIEEIQFSMIFVTPNGGIVVVVIHGHPMIAIRVGIMNVNVYSGVVGKILVIT
tara:strand:+ start:2872 stop:3285 length:414 start_codon:yes stop_codon:yes gene_type:complete